MTSNTPKIEVTTFLNPLDQVTAWLAKGGEVGIITHYS